MNLKRRTLLAAAGGGLLGLAPGLRIAFADEPAQKSDVIVFLFLRFGMDGLSMVAPSEDGIYRSARPTIGVRSSGPGAGLFLDTHEGVPFFMNAAASRLHQMFVDKKLAIIHAAGVPTQNRSHFETQEMATHGLADNEPNRKTGWLARHLLAKADVLGDFEAVSDGQGVTTTLDGAGGSISFNNLASLGSVLQGRYADAITAMHKGNGLYDVSAQKALRAAVAVREKALSMPLEAPNPNYTYGGLSAVLRPLAQVLKLDIGVQIATADFIGWDHHEYQPTAFPRQAQELADSLYAFTDDLGPMANRVTIVAMTEFGRRVRENANNGTDHGSGSVMFALGAGVNGGKFYGQWPGLGSGTLDRGDLPVVTDYRRVLSELLVRRQGQKNLDQVFPTVPYNPLGIFRPLS